MTNILKLLILSSLLVATSACTTVINKDYGAYLANNAAETDFPKVKVVKQYHLTPYTQKHSKKIKSAMAGWANTWVLEFGGVIDDTMQSEPIVDAMGELKKVDTVPTSRTLVINLDRYDFSDKRAHVDMTMEIKSKGKTLFKKSYKKKGPAQGGKMFWGGAAAMKNAVQQSTKNAVDQVFTSFLGDVKKKIKK